MNSDHISCDVCIIGGGIAGLFCAYLLSQNDRIHICLIERSDHVGGRIRSNNWNVKGETFVVEHGAYRFNPLDHPTLFNMIQHFGLEKYLYKLESKNIFFPKINK